MSTSLVRVFLSETRNFLPCALTCPSFQTQTAYWSEHLRSRWSFKRIVNFSFIKNRDWAAPVQISPIVTLLSRLLCQYTYTYSRPMMYFPLDSSTYSLLMMRALQSTRTLPGCLLEAGLILGLPWWGETGDGDHTSHLTPLPCSTWQTWRCRSPPRQLQRWGRAREVTASSPSWLS